jgi:hypothetical protein
MGGSGIEHLAAYQADSRCGDRRAQAIRRRIRDPQGKQFAVHCVPGRRQPLIRRAVTGNQPSCVGVGLNDPSHREASESKLHQDGG